MTALQQIAPEAIVPALGAQLKSKLPATRRDAALALSRLGPTARAAVPDRVNALEDSQPTVRAAAAGALGRSGREARAAAPALAKLLADADNDVRVSAIPLPADVYTLNVQGQLGT